MRNLVNAQAMKRLGVAAFLLTFLLCAGIATADFVNPSFETGDFTGWATTDPFASSFPLSVQGPGTANTFGWPWSSTPTDGVFTAFSGFDGAGPGVISVAQDIPIPVGISSVEFDWRAAWDLATFGATVDRRFDLNIQPAGGGASLFTQTILTAPTGSINPDTGQQSSVVDVSAFGGQTVRVSFDLVVPENFTGPAQFQLDNVHLQSAPVPEPATFVLLGTGFLSLFGYAWRRRKQAA